MCVRTIIIALFIAVFATSSGCRRGTKSEGERFSATPEEARDRFLKAMSDKDLRALEASSDVPWLDRDRLIVRDREGLPAALERALAQVPADLDAYKIDMIPYRDLQRNITVEAERKLLDEVMGDEGVIVEFSKGEIPIGKRYLLIRVKEGRMVVVAGPLKENQLVPSNPIPERVQRLLDHAESFELLSLDPSYEARKSIEKAPTDLGFHGWKVLGRTGITDQTERKKLVEALRLGAEDNAGMVAGCFIPHHGLRLKSGKETVDLVICFTCLSVHVYVNGNMAKGFLTTVDPQKTFDAALNAAGVKMPERAK